MEAQNPNDNRSLFLTIGGIAVLMGYEKYRAMSTLTSAIAIFFLLTFALGALWFYYIRYSPRGRENQRRLQQIRELPLSLIAPNDPADCVSMGIDLDLNIPIYLPDSIRTRHVHILGATGSGKTESVILNFLRQDVQRGIGSIVIDAKGDKSFVDFLNKELPKERLRIFDLTCAESTPYNPLCVGSPLEAAQRLFSSLVWSEEYYASKARSVLQKIFEFHYKLKTRNPTIAEVAIHLASPSSLMKVAEAEGYPIKQAEKDFADVSGLRDQILSLCTGHLSKILSEDAMKLETASEGMVLYFRLQSLMSPQIVTTLGKLLINHLNFLAGMAHRGDGLAKGANLIPTYVDEFAAFACPEFADLISKARSAKIALHFSHQSIGDLQEVTDGFLNRITDNSATKIILRINDPDSAEYMSRTFGTKLYQKVTQRITNAKEVDTAEVLEEGTTREAHQFRAPPDLLKTLPTGVGSVLIAHGFDTPHGASTVFKIKFPKLKGD